MMKHRLFWPLMVLGVLLLFNLIYSPDFSLLKCGMAIYTVA